MAKRRNQFSARGGSPPERVIRAGASGITNKLETPKGDYYSIFIYLLIFLVAFLVLAPIIIPQVWPASHDGATYILRLDNFRDAVMNGILYPRWLPDLYGGYGYPTFLFYQPGFFFTALPFSFLPDYPLSTMYVTLVFLFFIGGVGVYKLCKECSDSLTGFFCSILFLLTPYLYVNLYVRGDLSELTGMLLCPWPIFFLTIIKKRVSDEGETLWPMVGTSISLLMVIISHPATAMFFLPVFCLIAIYVGFNMDSRRGEFLFKVAVSVALGLVLSSPYWLTVFQMKKYVDLQPALSGDFSAQLNTVHFSQFFSRNWGFGTSADDGMSFQLGLPHFILATIGFLWGRKNRMIQVSYTLYLILILLMTPLASMLWKEITFFRYVQFPWRILSVTATLQIICVSGLKSILPGSKSLPDGISGQARLADIPGIPERVAKRAGIWNKAGILLVLLCISVLWCSNQFQSNKKPIDGHKALRFYREHKLEMFYTYCSTNELLPKTASHHPMHLTVPRKDTPLLVLNPHGEMKELKGNTCYRIHYQVTNKVLTNVLINQIYIPGWRVILDGNDIPLLELEQGLKIDGRIEFLLLPGENHTIEAFYEGPPGWRRRNIAIGTFLLGFIAFCFYDKKSRWRKYKKAIKQLD